MSTSATTASSLIPPPIMSLSSNEFAHMMLHSDMPKCLATAFTDDPVATVALRYYSFLTETIERLEKDLLRQRIEQQDIFGHLIRKQRFQQQIAPLVSAYRRQTREERYHPYSRTPSPPHCENKDPPSTPLTTHISPSTSSPPSPTNRSSGSSPHEVGTKHNPISIGDDELPPDWDDPTEWQLTADEIRRELRKQRDY